MTPEDPMDEFRRLAEENDVQGVLALLNRHGIPDWKIPARPSSEHEFWFESLETLLQKAVNRRVIVPGKPTLTPKQEAEEIGETQRSLKAMRESRELIQGATWLPPDQREKTVRSLRKAERALEKFLGFGLDD